MLGKALLERRITCLPGEITVVDGCQLLPAVTQDDVTLTVVHVRPH